MVEMENVVFFFVPSLVLPAGELKAKAPCPERNKIK